MKRGYLILGLFLTLGFSACSQVSPIPREQLAANMAPILKVERRADQVKYYTEMLLLKEGMSRESAEKLKATHDVYYVYYLAATLSLARGNLDSYLAHLRLAERELDSMETILKNDLAALNQQEQKQRFFNSGF